MKKSTKTQKESKHLTAADRMQAIESLEKLDIPWKYGTRPGFQVTLFGSQICFTNDGDYLSLSEAKELIKYWANELGLKVTE